MCWGMPEKYQQAFGQRREVITERTETQINLFRSYEGYIVWLLGWADSTQWTHPVCLLCISTCCGRAPPTELIISPVTVSFVLPRLAVTVVRGSTWIWEILSSTCQILQTLNITGETIPARREGWEIVVFLRTDRVMHQVVVGLCQSWSENYNL